MSQPQSQPKPDALRGTQIGPYEVVSRLALGGMAELLLARRLGIQGFQKLVVLKRILPQYAANPDFVDMFLHEARLAAALEHPNIVQVFDIGKSDDDYYFAMAYLHGKDALALLRELGRTKSSLPVEHAIAIASGIAAGLHHAHEQIGFDGRPLGIVHRDVSPANAIVTFDGTVKLVDFGIAKAAAQVNHTRAGVRKGKAAYMSPEQCRGDTLDRRTDIWSLGVMLYELLTMTRLFKADNDLAMMHRIVSTDAPSPRVVRPDLAPALEAIVMRCLQRDREQRYPTAAALQHDLDVCAHELGLRPGAAGLSAFLRSVFGTPPLPWASTTDGAITGPVTHSVELDADLDSTRDLGNTPRAATSSLGSRPDLESTRDLGNTPPPAVHTQVSPGPPAFGGTSVSSSASVSVSEPSVSDSRVSDRGRGIAVALGLVAIAGLTAWLAWPDDTAAPASTPSAASTPAGGHGPAAPTVTPAPAEVADVDAWLAIVNADDVAANPIGERHRLLDALRRTPAATRIDGPLQVRLDLLQASGAARPCETFAGALEVAAKDPAAFAEVLARAEPPDPLRHIAAGRAPDRSCGDLAGRLAAARGEPSTSIATPDVARPTGVTAVDPVPVGEPKIRRRRPTTAEPSTPTPTPAASKLDDELRPFRK